MAGNFDQALDAVLSERPISEENDNPDASSGIGEVVNGIKLTEKGLHREEDGMWYFPRLLKNPDGTEKGVYWYRKHRTSGTEHDPEGRVKEFYVGKEADTLPFKIPAEFRPHMNHVIDVLHTKSKKKSEA